MTVVTLENCSNLLMPFFSSPISTVIFAEVVSTDYSKHKFIAYFRQGRKFENKNSILHFEHKHNKTARIRAKP